MNEIRRGRVSPPTASGGGRGPTADRWVAPPGCRRESAPSRSDADARCCCLGTTADGRRSAGRGLSPPPPPPARARGRLPSTRVAVAAVITCQDDRLEDRPPRPVPDGDDRASLCRIASLRWTGSTTRWGPAGVCTVKYSPPSCCWSGASVGLTAQDPVVR